MFSVSRVVLPCLLLAGASCTKAAPAPAPAPVPAPVPAPTTAPAAAPVAQVAAAGSGAAQPTGGRGQPGAQAAGVPPVGAPAGGPGGPPRPTLTPEQRAARRDSLAAVRAQALDGLKKQIAGRENEPAGQVFKNVQLGKETPAGMFLNSMDIYGRALSVGCSFCHIANQFDSDSLRAKKTTRIMIGMVGAINTEQLSKLPAGRGGQTPRIGCTTCHRGNQTPGNALLP